MPMSTKTYKYRLHKVTESISNFYILLWFFKCIKEKYSITYNNILNKINVVVCDRIFSLSYINRIIPYTAVSSPSLYRQHFFLKLWITKKCYSTYIAISVTNTNSLFFIFKSKALPLLNIHYLFLTSAFWMGDTRQQITTLQLTQRSRKSLRTSQLSAYLSVFPSITRATSFCFRNWSPNSELCLAITSRVFWKEIPSIEEIQHWGNGTENESQVRNKHEMEVFLPLFSKQNVFHYFQFEGHRGVLTYIWIWSVKVCKSNN